MMREFKPIIIVLMLFLSIHNSLIAQAVLVKGSPVHIMINREIKLISGEIQSIKGIQHLKVRFDYSSMAVCDFNTEQDYLDDLRKGNSEKRAERYIKEWQSLAKATIEAKFIHFFNKNASDIGLSSSADTTLNLPSLFVKVVREDPHAHIGPDGMPPNASFECTFFDKEGEFLLRYTLTAFGSKEKNLQQRFEEVYAIGGKMLARDLTKRMLKYDEQNFKKE